LLSTTPSKHTARSRIAQRIIKLSTKCRLALSFTLLPETWQPLDRRLVGPPSRWGSGEEYKLFARALNPWRFSQYLVNIQTELRIYFKVG